jgi:predicted secreted protein
MTGGQVIEVDGRAGEPIELPVGSTAASGHRWRLELPDDVKLVAETSPVDAPEGERAGAATGSHLVVTAPAGRHELVARLARPWETQPVRVIRIVLNVS